MRESLEISVLVSETERRLRTRFCVLEAKGLKVTGWARRLRRSTVREPWSTEGVVEGEVQSAMTFVRKPGRWGVVISRVKVGFEIVRALKMEERVARTALWVAGGSGLYSNQISSSLFHWQPYGKKRQ